MLDKKELKGRGLFVFSDPGGAKPVLSLVNQIKHQLVNYKIVSDRKYDFYDEFNLEVFKPDAFDDITQLKLDFIFTGTSYSSKIELDYIKLGKQHNIITYSFVDHYINIVERFIKNEKKIFPDLILVINKNAKLKALEAGIIPSRLKIFSNPYHEYIRDWKPSISKNIFFDINHLRKKKLLLTFAPDPLSNLDFLEKYGEDEVSISILLLDSLRSMDCRNKFQILVKSHSNQDHNYLFKVFRKSDLDIIFVKEIDTKLLLYYSDLVIGIFSNILKESKVFDKKIIRILGSLSYDPFEDQNIGVICKTKDDLIKTFKRFFQEIN